MQPETTNTTKLSRAEIRRQKKADAKAEKSKAKKKNAKSTALIQYDEELLQKAEEIMKDLKAQTWRELETKAEIQ